MKCCLMTERNKVLLNAKTWMDPENMLSERRLSQKTTDYKSFYIKSAEQINPQRQEVVAEGEGGWEENEGTDNRYRMLVSMMKMFEN